MPNDVLIYGSGSNAKNIAQVDPAGSLRSSARPIDVGSGGSYQLAYANGGTVETAAMAANSPIFTARWASNAYVMLLRSLRFTMSQVTAFAAGAVIINSFRASGFTVQDTGGGAVAWTLAKPGNKSTRFNASQFGTVGSIQAATTGVLTAGTRSKDTNPFGSRTGYVGAAPAGAPWADEGILFDARNPFAQPQEFLANEGFTIEATVPATGTWFWSVVMEWDEVPAALWLNS